MSELLDIVSPYLKRIKPSGNENIMAICPFHRKADGSEERSGSFSMNRYNGLWYCHSCHEAGSIRSFLKRVGVTDFIVKQYDSIINEAAKSLPGPRSPLEPLEPCTETLEEDFLGLFDAIPQEILDEHLPGFDPDLLRHFDIGFDTMHQRITYPLRDLNGRLIGISGRSLGRGSRYKIYDKEYLDWGLPARATEKRVVIWNAHTVQARLRLTTDESEKYIVVTEGFKGCMRVVQAGIYNTVALLGSHMSDEQEGWIRRLDAPVYLMLDNDEAGFQGTLDAGKALAGGRTSAQVVPYSTAQPSDLEASEVVDSLLSSKTYEMWFVELIMNNVIV